MVEDTILVFWLKSRRHHVSSVNNTIQDKQNKMELTIRIYFPP